MSISLADQRASTDHLILEGVSAGYGGLPVIRDVYLSVGRGVVVGIIGPNGAGKSTLLKAITGVIPTLAGRVTVGEHEITNLRTDVIARSGVGYVPQVRHVFPRLTVRENLEMGGYTLARTEIDGRIEEVLDVFPALRDITARLAANLSGGESRMLGMGRILMTRPSVVLLDEPTASLSPRLASQLLREQVVRLAERGVAVLVVEQRAVEVLSVSDWAYLMRAGEVLLSEPAKQMRERKDIGRLFLGRSSPGHSPGSSGSVSGPTVTES